MFLTSLTLSDGLVDCMDPDCCLQATCHTTSLCVGSPDPLDIIQETQMSSAQSNLQTFYDRVRFLVGRDSTHIIPGANPFDGKWVTFALLSPDSTQPSLTNSLNNITRTSYGIGLNSLFILHRRLLFMLKILVRFLLVEPVKLSVDAQWTQQLCYRFLK